MPGVPDTYQGSELWHQSLVDPDNRRPVDYELRRRYLADLIAKRRDPRALAKELLETYPDGRIKQYVVHSVLQLRKTKPDLFLEGDYVALDAAEQAVAFSRTCASESMVCVVPRFSHRLAPESSGFRLGQVWGERAVCGVSPGRYRSVFTDEVLDIGANGELPLARAFASFPIALLIGERP